MYLVIYNKDIHKKVHVFLLNYINVGINSTIEKKYIDICVCVCVETDFLYNILSII